ncbi:putative TIM barrel metal-dependent hydrolase [Aspergillus clavatus NRRL 1]|uniref:TIM barrel metal-dependent hydrolase, putative n=1 Tax=Aspergillus clavatus (strain ATCC 1007 / CBS 513.65 / DSM 816 / NCTC 3887 / NRRL 1 / QM 1276 / 107) TaxID=344612 RepID=A1CNK6_ASPCL|nr:TIM barrel metal-dependent hydrolase, putative [Aspergillus clavatus NRRL 1]EAW07227.1 TIM barrel metal-dependent hydrolase, putative [Aspergillus clavatus NRRL 1]
MATFRSGLLRRAFRRHCFELHVASRPRFTNSSASHLTATFKPASVSRGNAVSFKERIPPRSWDSHMHVVEPHRYMVSRDAAYTPSSHTLEEALAFESTVGMENIVLVQPSIYGTDNSCLLAALQRVGPARGRGVVVIDPTSITHSTLASWHKLGVCGIRVNFQSVGKVLSESELAETLMQHANIIRPLGWMIQLYLPLRMVPMLEAIVPRLGVKVCIDHYGSPDFSGMTIADELSINPYILPGFSSLVSLLQAGQTYVKISAPYRFGVDNRLRDIEAITTELLQKAPRRLVYATDWPHTRFPGVDIGPFTEMCLRLCAREPGLTDQLFRLNAEELMRTKEEFS